MMRFIRVILYVQVCSLLVACGGKETETTPRIISPKESAASSPSKGNNTPIDEKKISNFQMGASVTYPISPSGIDATQCEEGSATWSLIIAEGVEVLDTDSCISEIQTTEDFAGSGIVQVDFRRIDGDRVRETFTIVEKELPTIISDLVASTPQEWIDAAKASSEYIPNAGGLSFGESRHRLDAWFIGGPRLAETDLMKLFHRKTAGITTAVEFNSCDGTCQGDELLNRYFVLEVEVSDADGDFENLIPSFSCEPVDKNFLIEGDCFFNFDKIEIKEDGIISVELSFKGDHTGLQGRFNIASMFRGDYRNPQVEIFLELGHRRLSEAEAAKKKIAQLNFHKI